MLLRNEAEFLKAHPSVHVVDGVEVHAVGDVVQAQRQAARVQEAAAPRVRRVHPEYTTSGM